jgi:FHS family glucose/mannose:H+ symporter-like MFS transporter
MPATLGLQRSGAQSAAIHIGFALTGIVTTLLGPMIPVLSAKWSLDDARAGYLFTAQFAGSMIGVALSSRLAPRLGFIRLLAVGFTLMCIGVAGLAVSGYDVGIASVLGYGVGLGITIPTTNLLVAATYPDRRAAALNLVNFSWSVGAVASPPIIATLALATRISAALTGLSAGLALIALTLVRLAAGGTAGGITGGARRAGARVPWRSSLVLLISALVFLYVGTENAIAGWAGSFALRLSGSAGPFWSLAPSIFWAALLVGRVTAPAVLRRVTEEKLTLTGLAAASSGALVVILSTGMIALLTGVAVAGLGMATVYPTTIALLSRRFGELASRVGGLVFALAGLGGATLPWAVGWVSTHSGSLRVGLGIPLLCSLAMVVLQIGIISVLIKGKSPMPG